MIDRRRLPTALFTGLILLLGAPACSGTVKRADTASGASAATPASASGELRSLLSEMTLAVRAADRERYLACVHLADPAFATEQRNWAADLASRPPLAFEVRMADPESEPAARDDGSLGAEVVFEWKMPGGSERRVRFPARFARHGSRWLYAGEDWRTIEAPGVRVLFGEGMENAAGVVAEVLPAVRTHIHRVFDLPGSSPLAGRVQEVKLYRTVRHLQHSIYLSYSDGLAGWNEPGESIKLLAGGPAAKNPIRVILAHEYGHVATFELGPAANDMPWWVLEGVAELSAQTYARSRPRTERRVRAWADGGELIDWDRLSDFRGEAANHTDHVYTQGHHMLIYITDRFGDTGRNAWLRAMAGGATLDEATRTVMNIPFAELDAQWREALLGAPSGAD